MTTIVPEGYLKSLGERANLETLLVDLIKGIGLIVTSRPQRGPRQHGVDIAAVGVDPDDGMKKLFLFVVKSGDINRTAWQVGTQSIRASLEQVLDVYLSSCIPAEHAKLPVIIVVATGGSLLQTCQIDWSRFSTKHSTRNCLIALWDGDRLSDLIDKHRLGEALIPRPARQAFRKLLLLDDNAASALSNFDNILRELLGPDVRKRDIGRATQQIKIVLDLLANWSETNNGLHQAWLCAESALLRTWEWGRANRQLKSRVFTRGFSDIYGVYFKIASMYVRRLLPYCRVRDGLSKTQLRHSTIEYHLWLYDIIGHIAMFAMSLMDIASKSTQGRAALDSCRDALASLIDMHSISDSPAFDGHVTEIAAALMVMLPKIEYRHFAKQWIRKMMSRIRFAYQICGRGYPIDADTIAALIDAGYGDKDRKEQRTRISTLFPILAEFCMLLNDEESYGMLVKLIREVFPHTNLQMWHPNEETDAVLYTSNAGMSTGFTCAGIRLPDKMEDLKTEIVATDPKLLDSKQLTCFNHKFSLLAWISARHYRSPLVPLLWRAPILNSPNPTPLSPSRQN